MRNKIAHIRKDFEDYLDGLPEQYSPAHLATAAQFAFILSALNYISSPPVKPDNDPVKEISDELESVAIYAAKFKEYGDENYKRMAWDEMSHAEYLLKQARMSATTKDEQEDLKYYQGEYDRLLHIVNAL